MSDVAALRSRARDDGLAIAVDEREPRQALFLRDVALLNLLGANAAVVVELQDDKFFRENRCNVRERHPGAQPMAPPSPRGRVPDEEGFALFLRLYHGRLEWFDGIGRGRLMLRQKCRHLLVVETRSLGCGEL